MGLRKTRPKKDKGKEKLFQMVEVDGLVMELDDGLGLSNW